MTYSGTSWHLRHRQGKCEQMTNHKMEEIDALYRQGKERLAAQQYADALSALRQVRGMHAGHYKDTDQLIVEAQTRMQKQKWQARSPRAPNQVNPVLIGVIVLFAILAVFALSTFLSAPASPGASSGGAGKLAPQQRSEMYKSAPAMTIDVNKTYIATIKTAKGSIVAELYPKDAPQHVNNFVFLARDGFFNNLTFHRVEPGFVIQGGDPLGTGTGGPGYTVPPEIKAKHTNGALAMARQGGPAQTTPSSGSKFYITLAPQSGLDGQYTVFGQVTSGLEVVAKIARGDVIQSVTIEEK